MMYIQSKMANTCSVKLSHDEKYAFEEYSKNNKTFNMQYFYKVTKL